MSELGSAAPTAGGLYYWTFKFSSPRYRKLLSWLVGCEYLPFTLTRMRGVKIRPVKTSIHQHTSLGWLVWIGVVLRNSWQQLTSARVEILLLPMDRPSGFFFHSWCFLRCFMVILVVSFAHFWFFMPSLQVSPQRLLQSCNTLMYFSILRKLTFNLCDHSRY